MYINEKDKMVALSPNSIIRYNITDEIRQMAFPVLPDGSINITEDDNKIYKLDLELPFEELIKTDRFMQYFHVNAASILKTAILLDTTSDDLKKWVGKEVILSSSLAGFKGELDVDGVTSSVPDKLIRCHIPDHKLNQIEEWEPGNTGILVELDLPEVLFENGIVNGQFRPEVIAALELFQNPIYAGLNVLQMFGNSLIKFNKARVVKTGEEVDDLNVGDYVAILGNIIYVKQLIHLDLDKGYSYLYLDRTDKLLKAKLQ